MIRSIKQQKKVAKRAGQRQTKRFNYCFIALLVVNALYMSFAWDTTIGHNKYYIPFIIILPAIIGIFFIIKFGGSLFIVSNRNERSKPMNVGAKIAIIFFAFLFSLFSFSFTATSLFDIANKIACRFNEEETITCSPIKFNYGKRCNITFSFLGNYEYISVSYRDIKDYIGTDQNEYAVKLKVQKGIWGYYNVNKWNLVVP